MKRFLTQAECFRSEDECDSCDAYLPIEKLLVAKKPHDLLCEPCYDDQLVTFNR